MSKPYHLQNNISGADTPVDPLQLANSHDEEAQKARERFEGRLLTRGSVKVVDVPASGFLLRVRTKCRTASGQYFVEGKTTSDS